jgi:hypothetical protein
MWIHQLQQRPACVWQQLRLLPGWPLPGFELPHLLELHGVRRGQISLEHRRHQFQLVLRVPEWQDIFGGRLKLYHSHMRQRPVCFRQQLRLLPGRPLPGFELPHLLELHGVRRGHIRRLHWLQCVSKLLEWHDIVCGRLLMCTFGYGGLRPPSIYYLRSRQSCRIRQGDQCRGVADAPNPGSSCLGHPGQSYRKGIIQGQL